MLDFLSSLEKYSIINPKWDLISIFAGLWCCILLFLLNFFLTQETILIAVTVASFFLGITHLYIPIYTVFFSRLFKGERQKHTVDYLWIPLLIIFVTFVLGFFIVHSESVKGDKISMNSFWSLHTYIYISFLAHLWHFQKQDFGILSFYRQKAGNNDHRARQRDQAYTIYIKFICQPIVLLNMVSSDLVTKSFFTFLPFGFVKNIFVTKTILFFAIAFSLFMIFTEYRNRNSSPFRMLYFFILLIQPILLFFSSESTMVALAFTILLLWSHWIASIGLAGKIIWNFNSSFKRKLIVPFISLVFIGIMIFNFRHLNIFSKTAKLFDILRNSYEIAPMVLAGLYCYFMCEQLLHFYADRKLFAFRSSDVRKNVLPLIK